MGIYRTDLNCGCINICTSYDPKDPGDDTVYYCEQHRTVEWYEKNIAKKCGCTYKFELAEYIPAKRRVHKCETCK
jgi:hypothetical protein